jgi:hypothetical protein
VKGAKKGTKDGKKGQKRWHRRVAMVASNGNDDEGVDNSGEEFIAAAERDFKWQTWPSKDHFKKLLEATYLHHPYPVKHMLKDCTMIKKFMMTGTFSRGSKPGGEPGEKSVVPIPEEAKVMTTFGWPRLEPENVARLVEPQLPYSLQ